ncbi:MAG: hypothetical protein MJK08_08550 [Campylobacterales bacterium]|nr:hypothetical protein [Campylobacterales bacterium]
MIQFQMENLINEILGFSIVTAVILMLAYYTKRKEEQFKKMNKELEEQDRINKTKKKD